MNNLFTKRREKISSYQKLRGANNKKTEIKAKELQSAFVSCPSCKQEITKYEYVNNLYVCPQCGYHHPVSAYYRLSLILDSESFQEINPKITSTDPLDFPEYKEKLAAQKQKFGIAETVVTARGKIEGMRAVFAVFDSRFFMGSMSAAVGEKVTYAIEYAHKAKLPLIIFSASGGARMQEGIYSLMQMAKTSAAIARFKNSGGLYISCFTHPTTGGVSASFASLGDITLAEPGALIGFAGPRVIEQTIGQKLPEGFQRAEYLVEHGFIDRIVERSELRDVLAQLLRLHEPKRGIIANVKGL